jgi:glycerol-3-phosphate dehydrogenase (NAD(P)+)
VKATVIGAGAWGTALADLLARAGHDVTLWAHEGAVSDGINSTRANERFLQGVVLDPRLRATSDMLRATDGAELVLFATPSHVLRAIARQSLAGIDRAATVAVATKGIEHGTFALMTDVVADEIPGRAVVALSGPSFAAEVAQGQPTAIVAASTDAAAATRVQIACSSPVFRVYTHDDVTGVELGGALKNVMAIAVGIADGLGLGYNTRAALITRGLAEIARLGTALGAQAATFAGLAGVGDLVLTCTGPLSRNRTLGVQIGEGKSLSETLADRATVAEGVPTAQSAHALAKTRGVDMPIVEAVHGILFEGSAARDAIRSLMVRELKGEQAR